MPNPIRKVTVSRLRVLVLSVVVAIAALAPVPASAAAVTTGVIQGVLTDAKGVPAANVYVELKSPTVDSWFLPLTYTDEAGHFSAEVPAGRYRVGFHFAETMYTHWVPRGVAETSATWFTVTAGGTVTVTDSLLPTGGLEVTMLDRTGTAPVLDFEVEAVGNRFLAQGSTTTGTVTLSGLPIGQYLVTTFVTGSTGANPSFARVTADTVTAVQIRQR